MKFLSPTSDIAFKKLFSEPKKNVVIQFLQDLTGNKISDLTFADAAITTKTAHTRFTLEYAKCIDNNGVTYIIEMQIINTFDYKERCQYYASVELSRQLQKTDSYKKLMPVVFVGISHIPVFDDEKEYSSHKKALNLLEYYFLDLTKFNKAIEKCTSATDQWAYLFKHAHELEEVPAFKNPLVVEALETLQQSNFTKKELEAHNDLVNAHASEINRMTGAREDGKYEAATLIAQKLLEQGMDLPQVSAVTGLAVNTLTQFIPAQHIVE